MKSIHFQWAINSLIGEPQAKHISVERPVDCRSSALDVPGMALATAAKAPLELR